VAVVLKVCGVSKFFGGVRALDRVDLEVGSGELRGILGPNGSGKTTLFNVISGFIRPTSGTVEFEGKDIAGLSAWQRAQLGIGRTFQAARVFRRLTVVENVALGVRQPDIPGLGHQLFGLRAAQRYEKEARDLAYECLAFVGLEGEAQTVAGTLPYGKMRLLELARAMALRPRLLLLDEPGAGLTQKEKGELRNTIDRIRRKGVTVILVEHDVKFVSAIADRITVLDAGAKLAEGSPDEVLSDPRVVEAYLGRRSELGGAGSRKGSAEGPGAQ
jgi:branched-chain amino acid transport system ATP-binding protein